MRPAANGENLPAEFDERARGILRALADREISAELATDLLTSLLRWAER